MTGSPFSASPRSPRVLTQKGERFSTTPWWYKGVSWKRNVWNTARRSSWQLLSSWHGVGDNDAIDRGQTRIQFNCLSTNKLHEALHRAFSWSSTPWAVGRDRPSSSLLSASPPPTTSVSLFNIWRARSLRNYHGWKKTPNYGYFEIVLFQTSNTQVICVFIHPW